MNKKELVKYISDHFEWFEYMQKGLGHHSWWYTNRSSEDCINVKLHAWVDVDEVKKGLKPRTLKIAEALEFDINEICNDLVWGDFGTVEQAREELERELKEKYRVSELEYGGRSGGWLCVVYEWENIPEDFEGGEYSMKELKKYYRIIREAEEDVSNVSELVNKRKKELERDIESVDYYTEELEQRISDELDTKQEKAKHILSLA